MADYIPRDLAFAETAPVIIEASHDVAATRAQIWAVLCDHDRWPEWWSSLRRARPTSDATGVGSTREVVLNGGLTFQERFIAWDEPSLWAFTGVEGPPVAVGLVERVTLEELAPDRTRVTYRMAVEPRRGFGLLVKVARSGIRRNLREALGQLDGVVAARRS